MSDEWTREALRGNIFYNADANGAGGPVLFAAVTLGLALNAGDFVMVKARSGKARVEDSANPAGRPGAAPTLVRAQVGDAFQAIVDRATAFKNRTLQ